MRLAIIVLLPNGLSLLNSIDSESLICGRESSGMSCHRSLPKISPVDNSNNLAAERLQITISFNKLIPKIAQFVSSAILSSWLRINIPLPLPLRTLHCSGQKLFPYDQKLVSLLLK